MKPIETTGVVVSESETPVPKEFRLQSCLDWLQDPKNEATIRAWSRGVRQDIETNVHKVDRVVTKVKDIIFDDDAPSAILDDLLGRFIK